MDAINGTNPISTQSTEMLNDAQQGAEEAIVNEQLQTIDTKIRSKRNEGAYARAGAFLSQNVG